MPVRTPRSVGGIHLNRLMRHLDVVAERMGQPLATGTELSDLYFDKRTEWDTLEGATRLWLRTWRPALLRDDTSIR
jgi:hypothetical protein